jgi:hypothetical protein
MVLLLSSHFVSKVFSQDVPESVEAALPERTLPGEPIGGQLQTHWLDPAGASAADFLGDDEPARLQDRQLLNDGRQSDLERLGQLAHRRRAPDQVFDHAATGRIA